MATPMDDETRRAFLASGTKTAALATVREDGRPHVAPVWFVLDGDVVVFMTGRTTVKGRNLLRTGTAAATIDDQAPPYSFVSLAGRVEVSEELEEMLAWSIKIAQRYMGSERAEEFGRRNAVEGELMVRLTPDSTVAISALAD